MKLQSERMEYLLDRIIIPSLKNKIGIKYKNFLEVMEKDGDEMFKRMAVTLGKHLMHCITMCIS